jgi:hypothetical protein
MAAISQNFFVSWIAVRLFSKSRIQQNERLIGPLKSRKREKSISSETLLIKRKAPADGDCGRPSLIGFGGYDPGVQFQTISRTLTGLGINPTRAKRSATACWLLITSSSTGTTR